MSDGVNTASAGTSIVVNNAVARRSGSRAPGYQGSATITLIADVTDPDPLATDTVAWTLTESGIVIGTATGTSFTFPIASPVGLLVGTVTATVTSSDGGMRQRQRADRGHRPVGRDGHDHRVGDHDLRRAELTVESISSAGARTGSSRWCTARTTWSTPPRYRSPVELDGYGGDATLLAGSGNDLLVAGPGANSLVGGAGDDTLVSNGGDDTLVGGTGNALFQINPGPDPLVIGCQRVQFARLLDRRHADHHQPWPESGQTANR